MTQPRPMLVKACGSIPSRRRSTVRGRREFSIAAATRVAAANVARELRNLARTVISAHPSFRPGIAGRTEHGTAGGARVAPAGQPRHAPGARVPRNRLPRLAARRSGVTGCGGRPGGPGEDGEGVMSSDRGNGGVLRSTEGRGRLYDSIVDTVGDTPVRAGQPAGAGACRRLRQVRVLQPGRLGQGPAGAQHHRGRRARRHAEARADRGRGDQRQHRHRPRHGLRRQGLSAGRDHGRQLLDRAAAADAHPRRQGGADAAGAQGPRHVHEGEGAGREARLVPRPPVRDRRPTPTSTRARPRGRSSPTSRAGGSTISSPATAPAARWRGSGGC